GANIRHLPLQTAVRRWHLEAAQPCPGRSPGRVTALLRASMTGGSACPTGLIPDIVPIRILYIDTGGYGAQIIDGITPLQNEQRKVGKNFIAREKGNEKPKHLVTEYRRWI